MPDAKTIRLTGSTLSVSDVELLIHSASTQVALSPQALDLVRLARVHVDNAMKEKVIYGVNTGFGPMASHVVGKEQLAELQSNLIRSHAAGMGKPLPEEYVLAAMVVRLNTLIKGFSGVSEALLKQLQQLINLRIIPIVPEHGAVGTSGDLTQLAHIALAVIGEGEVMYQGKRQTTKHVFKTVRMKPYTLLPKEGLALINGTSMMTGIGAIVVSKADRLLSAAVQGGACALEVVHALHDGIDETLHHLRPHHGQVVVARTLRALLRSSHLLTNRETLQNRLTINDDVQHIDEHIQEVYSLRCIPQILGPVLDTIISVQTELEIEMNAVTDNPIVDVERNLFLHGGNFHGDYIALGMDRLKIVLSKLSMLVERQINYLLHSAINERFSPFLNMNKPGLTLALQGIQFVATSTTARNQTLSFPQYLHSIPTNADNQDVVSMGADAALLTAEVAENTALVLAIQCATLAQAVDFLDAQKDLSRTSQEYIRNIRKRFKKIVEDRSTSQELEALAEYIRTYPSLKMQETKV